MRVQCVFLCDLVEITDQNLFNVYGGGITAVRLKELPDTQFLAMALCVEYNLLQESGNHTIEIRVVNGSDEDIMEPEKYDAVFADDYNLYHMTYNFTPTFSKYEEHSVIVTIDDVEIATLPVEILPEKEPQLKPETIKERFRITGSVPLNGNFGKWRDESDAAIKDLLDSKKMKEFKRRLQHDDICLVKNCAASLGLALVDFKTNEALEIYFSAYKGKESLCYISKGWGDSGFRVGELVEIDKNTPDFKERFATIFNICSTNLISVKVLRSTGGKVGLSMEIGLYQDGFNEKVLREAIDSLRDSVRKIQPLLK